MKILGLYAAILLLLLACPVMTDWLGVMAPHPAPAAAGDAARGERLFREGVGGAPPCSACHLTAVGAPGFSLAPNLGGIAERAAGRIEGMTAQQYIEDSILHPTDLVIPGYHVSMFTDYADFLSPQDLADLVAYLLTL